MTLTPHSGVLIAKGPRWALPVYQSGVFSTVLQLAPRLVWRHPNLAQENVSSVDVFSPPGGMQSHFDQDTLIAFSFIPSENDISQNVISPAFYMAPLSRKEA